MKRIAIVVIISAFFISASVAQNDRSFYDYSVTDIQGKQYDLSTLKGKKVLVVNTASKCGNTPQFAELEKLYKEYGSEKFVILGFPSNDFANQDPGTNEEILEFCTLNYGVTFPMMSKISVKGKDIHPLYEWLTNKELNGIMDSEVTWNFQKYLIDENGKLVEVIPPRVKPDSEQILAWLKR